MFPHPCLVLLTVVRIVLLLEENYYQTHYVCMLVAVACIFL